MTTVGPELTNIIDPNVTWKPVTRVRSSSRRSRRSTSTNSTMSKELGKRSPLQADAMEVSKSKKSDVSIHGVRSGSTLEHIPIKKRRFLLRSPSPPPQPSSCSDESEGLSSAPLTSDLNTSPELVGMSQTGTELTSVMSDNTVSGGKIDDNCANTLKGVQSSGEDFSGIAILAAAACSGGLDNCDAGKSEIGISKAVNNESLASVCNKVESNDTFAALPEKDKLDIKEATVITELPMNGPKVEEANEFLKADITESAPVIAEKKGVECFGTHESDEKEQVRQGSPVASLSESKKDTDNLKQSSGTSRDSRLHWDLNVAAEEWDQPLDDSTADSGVHLGETQLLDTMDCQQHDNVQASEGSKESESMVPAERKVDQPVVPAVTENTALPNNSEFILETATFGMMKRSSDSYEEKPSFDVADIGAPVDSVGAVTMDVDHCLSLEELNGSKTSASKEPHVPKEDTHSGMDGVQPEKQEIDFLLTPLSGSPCQQINADCRNFGNCLEKDDLDDNDHKLALVTCQSNVLGGNNNEDAEVVSLGLGDVSCEANTINSSSSVPPVEKSSIDDGKMTNGEVIATASHSSTTKSIMKESEDSAVAYHLSKSEGMGEPHEKPTTTVITSGTPEKPVSLQLPDATSEAHVPITLDPCAAVNLNSKQETSPASYLGNVTPKNPSDITHETHNDDSSQVTGNNGTVSHVERGYDSHLEDGELRESVGHCWEENGEDFEIEHVDYDSDNREGTIFYEDANDSTQMPGEVLSGEFGKQRCHSDNVSYADYKSYPDKDVKDICFEQFQSCSPIADATELECMERESSTLRTCSAGKLNKPSKSEGMEMDKKVSVSSGVETGSSGRELGGDALQNDEAASPSGRGLQLSARRSFDSIRRSRSSNFDPEYHTRASDDLLIRGRSSQHLGRFAECSPNPELRSAVADSTSDDDRDRVRGTEDNSPGVHKPRIIPTSRSAYHPVNRGSQGQRDNEYSMGMVNTRDRFNRYSDGMDRDFREGYRRPGMMNHFGKRERSFSPPGDVVNPRYPRSHRKSRSRSRSRSPDFRSEVRMGRARLPYHAADHLRDRRVFNPGQRFGNMGPQKRFRSDDGIRPMMRPMRFHNNTSSSRDHDYDETADYRRKPMVPRGHRRSRSRSRSFSPDFRPDTRLGPVRVPYDHLRERRTPPVRVFRPGQRYDTEGSPGRMRVDNSLGPMSRPVRFPNTGPIRRGNEYNNGDECQRKPRNIFERIHPGRQNQDVEGDVRRFQYEDEADIPTQNFRRNDFVRAGDRRPVDALRNREDRGNVRYNNSDRMFYPGPKQFGGMRDYGDDGFPRRVRP